VVGGRVWWCMRWWLRPFMGFTGWVRSPLNVCMAGVSRVCIMQGRAGGPVKGSDAVGMLEVWKGWFVGILFWGRSERRPPIKGVRVGMRTCKGDGLDTAATTGQAPAEGGDGIVPLPAEYCLLWRKGPVCRGNSFAGIVRQPAKGPVAMPSNHTKPILSMTVKHTLFAAALLTLLAGCSSTNDVVSNGVFQKRKYQKGWHVDLRTGKRSLDPVDRTVAVPAAPVEEPVAAPVADLPVPQVHEPSRPAPIRHAAAAPVVRQAEATAAVGAVDLGEPVSVLARLERGATTPTPPAAVPEGENDRTNGMAIAGFVCAFFIPILGIIFSAIAMGQINRRGGRGYGLANAGLVISLVTILLLVVLMV
jgi:hypothetical protein